eukprot:gene19647-biopygen34296
MAGWYAEHFQMLLADKSDFAVLTGYLDDIARCRMTDGFCDWEALGRVVPARKGLGDKVRPLVVGDLARKTVECTLAEAEKEHFLECLAPEQHAVGLPAAIEKYAKSVICLVEPMDDVAVGLLDCISAYNRIEREPILEGIESECVGILAFMATFMCRKGKYVFYTDDGSAHVIESADGVDQGAAFSPGAFAFGLRRGLRRIRSRLTALLEAARESGAIRVEGACVKLLSFLDDVTLMLQSVLMSVGIDVAREELARLGLELGEPKTVVWAKSGRCPGGCEAWWQGGEGFVIVGAPFCGGRAAVGAGGSEGHEDEPEIDNDVREVAVGTGAFVRRFLEGQVTKVLDLIDSIVEIPGLAGAHQPAVQVANLLLRWCVPSKCIHLLRILPPDVTDEFCRDVDARVEAAFCEINECAEPFGDVQRHLYETTLAWGGLGMRPLDAVRHAAFVGAWMQCLSHVRQYNGCVIADFDAGWELGGSTAYSFHGEYRCALDRLGNELGVGREAYDVMGFSLRDALVSEHTKWQKVLSRTGRRPLASEWLVSAPLGALRVIPDQHYRVLVRTRLCMPTCQRGEPCRTRRAEAGGRLCGRELLPDADHAPASARSAIQARHNVLRNRCAAINREAGSAVSIETPVPGVLSSSKKEPIRADVLVREAPPGTWACVEKKVRHVFTSDGDARGATVDDMLRGIEIATHAKYRPVKVYPWIATSFGRPGEAMCTDLRRLARVWLRQPDVSRAVSVPSVLQLLLHQWRAEISCERETNEGRSECRPEPASTPPHRAARRSGRSPAVAHPATC